MSGLACAGLAVGLGTAIYGGIMAKKGADAQASQANAAGAFSNFQNKLAGLQKLTQANQIMDQAKQATTNIQGRANAIEGQVATAQGASGTQANVGSAAIAQEVIQKGAAADIAATMGSAINKQTSEVEAGMNNFIDGTNALSRGAAQASSLEAAGQAAETGSILSGVANAAVGAAKAGVKFPSFGSSSVSPSVSAGTAMSDFSTNQQSSPFAGDA